MKRLIRWLLLICIPLIPLIVWKNHYYIFETVKTFVFAGCVIFSTGILVGESLLSGTCLVKKSRLTLAVLIYFFYQSLSFFFFPYTDTLYFFQFSCLMCFTIVVSSVCTTTTRKHLLRSLIAFALFSSILGCFQFVGFPMFGIPADRFESKITRYFMLRQDAWDQLTAQRIPDEIIAAVQPLQDKRFETEAAFVQAVRERIGTQPPQQYVLILVKIARVLFGNRIFTTIGHPTFLGGFYVFILPIIAAFGIKNFRERRFARAGCYAIILILTLISLAMTQARGAWIACVCAFAVFALFVAKRSILDWCAAHVRLIVLLVVLCVFMILGSGLFILTRTDIADATSLNIRKYYYQVTLCMIQERPIFGRGLGTFSAYYPRYRDARISVRLGEPAFHYWVAHPHNEHLEILNDGGIIAYGIFLWIMMEAFSRFFSRRTLLDIGMAAALFGLLIDAMFSQNLRYLAVSSMFWLLIGFSDIDTFSTEEESANYPNKLGIMRLIGIGAVIMIAGFSMRFAYRLTQAEYYMKGGINLITVNIPGLAIPWLEKAVRYNPYDKLLLYSLASSYKQIGQYDGAITYFEKLQRHDPDFLLSQSQQGEIYYQRKQFDVAKIHLEQQVRSNTMHWPTYDMLANIAMDEGHPQQALSYLNEILDIEAVNDLQEVDSVNFHRIRSTIARLDSER